jgi:hypothetical protein
MHDLTLTPTENATKNGVDCAGRTGMPRLMFLIFVAFFTHQISLYRNKYVRKQLST